MRNPNSNLEFKAEAQRSLGTLGRLPDKKAGGIAGRHHRLVNRLTPP